MGSFQIIMQIKGLWRASQEDESEGSLKEEFHSKKIYVTSLDGPQKRSVNCGLGITQGQ